jgi:hypothetical protein
VEAVTALISESYRTPEERGTSVASTTGHLSGLVDLVEVGFKLSCKLERVIAPTSVVQEHADQARDSSPWQCLPLTETAHVWRGFVDNTHSTGKYSQPLITGKKQPFIRS